MSEYMSTLGQFARRLVKFRKKSKAEKLGSYVYRWFRWFPGVPAPLRLPTGDWWLTENDFIGRCLLTGGYENAEREFMKSFVKLGMTVLDVGAHRGFHTLLLSREVGPLGRVISFEPSRADRRRLKLHLGINLRSNVEVLGCALGAENGSTGLYVVPGHTVLNSLRPPHFGLPSHLEKVPIRKLDDLVSNMRLRIDFIKLDVEGGELEVLNGAEQMLQRVPRPVILCELLEETTRSWGYSPQRVVERLVGLGFSWFALGTDSELTPLNIESDDYHNNFVAVPIERLSEVARLQTASGSYSRVGGG